MESARLRDHTFFRNLIRDIWLVSPLFLSSATPKALTVFAVARDHQPNNSLSGPPEFKPPSRRGRRDLREIFGVPINGEEHVVTTQAADQRKPRISSFSDLCGLCSSYDWSHL